ncbi:hypothetical protein LCM17_18490 [Cereibacter sphaeroides]|nr:hypothetical protein [Cereibacter sphaeroides]
MAYHFRSPFLGAIVSRALVEERRWPIVNVAMPRDTADSTPANDDETPPPAAGALPVPQAA